jgi:transmembrane sensor
MNAQIFDEASDWLVKNREGDLDPDEKRRFDAWLRESPYHLRAYLEMSAVWEDVTSLDPGLNASADELIARARAEGNIFPLEVPASRVSPAEVPGSGVAELSEPSSEDRATPAARRIALAASILLLVAATSAWLYTQRNTYSTALGEQRSIVLNDGSTIELNSRSRVRVRFSDAERDVDLLEGQALFRVAKNPQRPFSVHSASIRVRAVGTQFDVYKKRAATVVTVVEGKVAVFGEPHSAAGGVSSSSPKQDDDAAFPLQMRKEGSGVIFLAAGEQLTVTPAAAASPERANVAAVTAWTQRTLVFDSAPLTEVAEEFNRYNTRQLVVKDPELADIHVSGVFSSVDPALLLRFLRTQPELVVEETDTEIRISKK